MNQVKKGEKLTVCCDLEKKVSDSRFLTKVKAPSKNWHLYIREDI